MDARTPGRQQSIVNVDKVPHFPRLPSVIPIVVQSRYPRWAAGWEREREERARSWILKILTLILAPTKSGVEKRSIRCKWVRIANSGNCKVIAPLLRFLRVRGIVAEDQRVPATGEPHAARAESAVTKEEAEGGGLVSVAPPRDARTVQESADVWLKVTGGFLVFFNIWGLPISFGAFESFYTLELRCIGDIVDWHVARCTPGLSRVSLGPTYDLGYWNYLFAAGRLRGAHDMPLSQPKADL